MRNRIPTNVRTGQQAISARVAGYAMPCVWSPAEITVAKRSTFLTKDHGKRPEEAPAG
jgi:hypothetical protein